MQFRLREKEQTKCPECNTECNTMERLEKHKAIAHRYHGSTRRIRRGGMPTE